MSQIEDWLLDRARRGLLRLNVNGTVEVEYFHCNHRRWKTKQPDAHPESGRARFRFGPRNCRRTVYRNRLVWILHHMQAIPDGHVVDHRDEDRLNDMPENLRLMEDIASREQGQRIRRQLLLNQLCRWFEFVFEYGREPETLREQNWVEDGF